MGVLRGITLDGVDPLHSIVTVVILRLIPASVATNIRANAGPLAVRILAAGMLQLVDDGGVHEE
ncbi:hypothetical protein C8R46DRAFT_1221017 [Mycena filopes]|nr:hypothetical protein C8R46DRAFT_1221017 [Mycena filopes]